MFLQAVNNFRGIAIILIVAGHCYAFGFGFDFDAGFGFDISEVFPVIAISMDLITGGTAFFVFISGFMFHYVFFPKFHYSTFMWNKIKNVGVPYIILFSLAMALLYVFHMGYFSPDLIDSRFAEHSTFERDDGTLTIFFKYFIAGNFLAAYWYIPFVMLLFLCAPLHVMFIHFSERTQLILILVLSIVSVFAQRPIAQAGAIHSLIYFTPIYLLGIHASVHNERVLGLIKNRAILLFSLAVLFSILEYLTGHQGNYGKPFFEYNGIDLMFIQKIFLILSLYSLLEQYTIHSKTLDTVSKTSFAIFFIHPWVLLVLTLLLNPFLGPFIENGYVAIASYLFFTFVVLFTSVMIAICTKKLFRDSKKTRYLIGY